MKVKTIKAYLFIRFFIAITIPFIVIALLVNSYLRVELTDKYYNQMITNTFVLEEDLKSKLKEFELLLAQMQDNIGKGHISHDVFDSYASSTWANYDSIERIDILDVNKKIIITAPSRDDFSCSIY